MPTDPSLDHTTQPLTLSRRNDLHTRQLCANDDDSQHAPTSAVPVDGTSPRPSRRLDITFATSCWVNKILSLVSLHNIVILKYMTPAAVGATDLDCGAALHT